MHCGDGAKAHCKLYPYSFISVCLFTWATAISKIFSPYSRRAWRQCAWDHWEKVSPGIPFVMHNKSFINIRLFCCLVFNLLVCSWFCHNSITRNTPLESHWQENGMRNHYKKKNSQQGKCTVVPLSPVKNCGPLLGVKCVVLPNYSFYHGLTKSEKNG